MDDDSSANVLCARDSERRKTTARLLPGTSGRRGNDPGENCGNGAYLANDSASHSFIGKTPRNSVMFGPVGHAYVYFIYGMHYCVNAVTGQAGSGEAVLIRALEPLQGIAVMQQRRRTQKPQLLCNGPARLTEALAITRAFNGLPLFEGPLQIWSADSLVSAPVIDEDDIVQTTRIGIGKAKELPLRFYLKGSRSISRP